MSIQVRSTIAKVIHGSVIANKLLEDNLQALQRFPLCADHWQLSAFCSLLHDSGKLHSAPAFFNTFLQMPRYNLLDLLQAFLATHVPYSRHGFYLHQGMSFCKQDGCLMMLCSSEPTLMRWQRAQSKHWQTFLLRGTEQKSKNIIWCIHHELDTEYTLLCGAVGHSSSSSPLSLHHPLLKHLQLCFRWQQRAGRTVPTCLGFLPSPAAFMLCLLAGFSNTQPVYVLQC